ncbi:glycosyltransferase family 4 protein [Pseudodesulfovibrio portus]|uniref:glycosyltransferase family 4 protein n=1 Tax=Pseudodesulfovibrio portus TaxID=231439 RepID=UPI0022314F50|nr:glycosyltransferase family 4 protein [Pseudodesulfovibrio portus]
MKIALCNHRYFISGGPEKYLFKFKALAEERGNSVMPISVHSPENEKCEYEDYFFSSVSKSGDAYFNPDDKSIATLVKSITRHFYSYEVYKKTRHFVEEQKPDVAYVLHYLNKISPAVIDSFINNDVPCVVRISDFGSICPQAHLYADGKICEECIERGYHRCIANRCVKGSLAASSVKVFAYYFNLLLRHRRRISAFVFPSLFTMEKYIECGFPAEKCHHVPTMIESLADEPANSDSPDRILFVGRFVQEKGVHQLLEAYAGCESGTLPLCLVGYTGKTDYEIDLKRDYGSIATFKDFASGEELNELYAKASFVVIPSVWYDNQPNVLLEAALRSKMVVVPRHGCFTDLVEEGVTGLFYNPDDVADLAEKMSWASDNADAVRTMGINASKRVHELHSSESHISHVMDIFNSVR